MLFSCSCYHDWMGALLSAIILAVDAASTNSVGSVDWYVCVDLAAVKTAVVASVDWYAWVLFAALAI
tara:strand:+ start:315 stop:515 length:201 start_codon:yes stop_codon:yes gene_type:complete